MAIITRGGPLKPYDSISLLFKNKCFVVYFFIFFYPELLKFLAMNWNALINFPNFARSFLANLFQVLVEHRCKLRGNESNHEIKLKETHTKKKHGKYLNLFSHGLVSCCALENKIVFTRQKFCLHCLDFVWIFKLAHCWRKQSQLSQLLLLLPPW